MKVLEYKKQMEKGAKLIHLMGDDYKTEIDFYKKMLGETLEAIELLECIYMGEKRKYQFSKTFQDEAYKERQDLCNLSSALNSLLREAS